MGAASDLLKSERGFYTLLLIAAVSAMVFTGHATIEQWIDYTKWIAGFYVAGKTVQGVADALVVKAQASVTAAVVAPAPEPAVEAPPA